MFFADYVFAVWDLCKVMSFGGIDGTECDEEWASCDAATVRRWGLDGGSVLW
jgi:hypothetical protein